MAVRNGTMGQKPPIATFYSIIGCSIAALAITHVAEIEGDAAMPVFMIAMVAGVILGEIIERLTDRSATN
jgi:Na+/glutamate symporter